MKINLTLSFYTNRTLGVGEQEKLKFMEDTILLKNGLTQKNVKVRQTISFIFTGIIPFIATILMALMTKGVDNLGVVIGYGLSLLFDVIGVCLLLKLSSNKVTKLLLISLLSHIILFILSACLVSFLDDTKLFHILELLVLFMAIYAASITITNSQDVIKATHKAWFGLFLAFRCLGFIQNIGVLNLNYDNLGGWLLLVWKYLIINIFYNLIITYKFIHCGIFDGIHLPNHQKISYSPFNRYFIGAVCAIVIVVLMCCAIDYFADEINNIIQNVNKRDVILK